MKIKLSNSALVTLGCALMLAMGSAAADVVSKAAKIGANAGARDSESS